MTKPVLSPQAAAFLERWHEMIRARDVRLLEPFVAEDAIIASPMFWKPKGPRAYVMAILEQVTRHFEDFHYTKEWIDEPVLLLEFEARIDDKKLKGIDRIVLGEDGRMTAIEVLIRPMNGLQALAEKIMLGLGTKP
ncbi:MAG: nuclear transport factor 2 family protein [Alphaproteobacteria bacterium]|nr:nuclear transport factor 2 family protein [Alphaproteobacteria bacterium]